MRKADIFDLTPGVTTEQGNGPRDISVSVRGSNKRQTYSMRNIQMGEDGLPITQPDSPGRTDMSAPHAYSGVDVIHGPSAALYGNYLTDGAVHFHSTRQIQGIEMGTDFGSHGYANDYLAAGVPAAYFNFHYNPSADRGLLFRLSFYFEVKDAISEAYVASASNITNSSDTTMGIENGVATLATSGVIWAGPPRVVYGGVRFRLRR